MIKDIIFWLFIFISGSLIVNWILLGGIQDLFHSSKEIESNDKLNVINLSEIKEYKNSEKENILRVETGGLTCNTIKALSSQNGWSMSLGAETSCGSVCSIQHGLGYYDYRCEEGDKFVCYCN